MNEREAVVQRLEISPKALAEARRHADAPCGSFPTYSEIRLVCGELLRVNESLALLRDSAVPMTSESAAAKELHDLLAHRSDYLFPDDVKVVELAATLLERTQPSSAVEQDSSRDFLERLITVIRSMDLQAEKLTKRDGDEDVVIGYKFNTGCWHRILGMISGHRAVQWVRTPEGQAVIKKSAERARATIEELEKARAIDWSKWDAANRNRAFGEPEKAREGK